MGSMLMRRSETSGRNVEEGRWPKTLKGEGTIFFFFINGNMGQRDRLSLSPMGFC